MNHPSEENLLGYVLGALDASEQRELQEHIDNDPELEDRLLEIKSTLLPLDYVETAGPRPGLARRTCEMVASNSFDVHDVDSAMGDVCSEINRPPHASGTQSIGLTSPAELASISEFSDPCLESITRRQLLQPSTWSFPDFAVAVASMAILAGILFPTLSYTRHQGRLAACQNNMQQLGNAFLRYSDMHDGRFIEIPRSGPLAASGCFAPILKDSGLIEDDNLFACAGANANYPNSAPVHIPSIEMLKKSHGIQLIHLQRTMGGHFGYTMGYVSTEGYFPPRNLGRTNVVLLADMPSLNLPGRRSANHAGRGQNCLFEDGHVQYVSGDSIGEDAIFVNDYNLVAPGCRPDDNVIAPSHLSPNLPR